MTSLKACLAPVSHFGVLLACPHCAEEIDGLECPACGFGIRIEDDILRALPIDRAERFARFARDYEFIRNAEGRFGDEDGFYFALPYRDTTGKNSAQWKIRARSYECLLHDVIQPHLPRGALILDVGAGNCWMSYRLALAGYRPVAADLLTNPHDGLGAAAHYRARLPNLFPRFQAEMDRLPFRNQQFDAIVFNAAFHYSEDYAATLRAALRCLRRSGMLIVCDTPWYSREQSGQRMLSERRAAFLARYGTASDSIASREFLTDAHLRNLEEALSICWKVYSPSYGCRWAARRLLARLRRKREPARFRIYVAWKSA